MTGSRFPACPPIPCGRALSLPRERHGRYVLRRPRTECRGAALLRRILFQQAAVQQLDPPGHIRFLHPPDQGDQLHGIDLQPHRAQIDRLYALRFVKAVEPPEPGRPYELRLVVALEQQSHPVLSPEIEIVRVKDGLPFDLPADREHLGDAVFGKDDIGSAVVQRADTLQQGKTRRRHETPSQNDIADTVQDKAAGNPRKEPGDGDTHRLFPGFMHYHLHPQPDFSFRDRANSSPKA